MFAKDLGATTLLQKASPRKEIMKQTLTGFNSSIKSPIKTGLNSYQEYHKHYTSQHTSVKKPCYRQKYKRTRVTRNGGDPIIPKPTKRFLHRPRAHFEAMTPADIAVLDAVIAFRAEFGWITCPSQNTIAKRAGVSRMTVSRSLFKLERIGVLSNNHRWHKASLYNIAGIFWDKTFIRKFRKWLPALLLLVIPNVTQTSNINRLVNLNNKPLTVLNTKRAYTDAREAERLSFQKKYVISSERAPLGPPRVCPKKENVVSSDVKEAIRDVAKCIRMSFDKKAWIACFPAPAINLALEAFQGHLDRGNTVDNPFGWFYAQCKKICAKERISPDTSVYRHLKSKYNFQENNAKTTKEDILYKPKPVKKKKKQEPKKLACHQLFTGHKPFDPNKKGPTALDIRAYQERMRGLQAKQREADRRGY